jgi:hypothetical protein
MVGLCIEAGRLGWQLRLCSATSVGVDGGVFLLSQSPVAVPVVVL